MSRTTSARRAAATASIALLALTAALVGCERRQSDVPAPTPSSPTTPSTGSTGSMGSSTSSDSSSSMPGSAMGSTAPMPGSAASDPMPPASAASR